MKCFWKFIKHQRTEHCGVVSLKVEGKLITDPKQKAEALNDHFQAVFTRELDISNLPTPASSAPRILPRKITKFGVQKLLKQLNLPRQHQLKSLKYTRRSLIHF